MPVQVVGYSDDSPYSLVAQVSPSIEIGWQKLTREIRQTKTNLDVYEAICGVADILTGTTQIREKFLCYEIRNVSWDSMVMVKRFYLTRVEKLDQHYPHYLSIASSEHSLLNLLGHAIRRIFIHTLRR